MQHPFGPPDQCAVLVQVANNTQCTVLRLATDCHLMSSHDHLQTKTKMLPVKPHNAVPKTPIQLLQGRSHNCATWQKWHDTAIPSYVGTNNTIMVTGQHINQYAHHMVCTVIAGHANNRVLSDQPPPINNNELQLLRPTRTTWPNSGLERTVCLRCWLFEQPDESHYDVTLDRAHLGGRFPRP